MKMTISRSTIDGEASCTWRCGKSTQRHACGNRLCRSTPAHDVQPHNAEESRRSTAMLQCARGFAIACALLLSGARVAASEAIVLNGCRLEPATNCSFAKLENASLRGVDLSDASMHGAVLSGADLRDANLQRADFQVGNLSKADLRGANLQEAHLFANDLRGAQLQGANLQRVNLQDAHLEGANLQGAKLDGAFLGTVRLDGATWIDGRVCAAPSQGACQ
jgi:uncharacterized protein YjbI with pentapeptide repeats